MTSTVSTTPAGDAASALALAVSCAKALCDAPLYRFSREQQLEVGRQLERLGRSVYAAQIAWVREMQNRGSPPRRSRRSGRPPTPCPRPRPK